MGTDRCTPRQNSFVGGGQDGESFVRKRFGDKSESFEDGQKNDVRWFAVRGCRISRLKWQEPGESTRDDGELNFV